MRTSILLPCVFAATLLSTVALAERPENVDREPHKGSAVKERVIRETRSHEAVEKRQRAQTKDTSVKSRTKAPEKVSPGASRGCTTDDGGSCSTRSSEKSVKPAATTSSAKAATQAPARLQQKDRGCSTDDGGGCTSKRADGSTKETGGARTYIVQTNARDQLVADEIMKMRAKVDAERILDMLKIELCTRNGSCNNAEDF
jgi:hypothetical protein